MRIEFKYKWINGAKRVYDYGYNQTRMITKEAKQRRKILCFWRQYGLKAAKEAFGASRSTLYAWWQIYVRSGYKIESLNPGSQAPKHCRKRETNPLIVKEIRRLRFEVCPNLGKDKVKKFLDPFCLENGLKIISISTIGRIIVDKKIYHHRQKVSHFGKIKIIKKAKKVRKPKDFITNEPGDLIEIDTIVKFLHGFKRYVVTAVDTHCKHSFAWSYRKANSANTRDFVIKLKQVFPYAIKNIQTDNGSEFHKYFAEHLKKTKIRHFWNYPRQPYKNGHVEKFNRTIQEEFMDWNETLMKEPRDFNLKLMDYLLWYNTQRPHWGLKLESPVDYLIENNWVSRMRWTDTIY